MTDTPSNLFRSWHALRIKGFAKLEHVAEIAALELEHVEAHLRELAGKGFAMFRENRGLWQLTAEGREAHAAELRRHIDVHHTLALEPHYKEFLRLNEDFKALCGDWQLRNGAPNDHSDAGYDARVIDRLVALDTETRPIVVEMGKVIERLEPYAIRLEQVCLRVVAGETKMFTGVMCGSYHDVWMELHEDLILTQGIDRVAEGSF
jgi:hypothetical protein